MFALVLVTLMKERHVDVPSSITIQEITCVCLVVILVINALEMVLIV